MLRLPGKTPLPAAAAGRLEKADCCRLLQVPGAAAGERHAFLCPSLTSLNGVTLALSLVGILVYRRLSARRHPNG